MNRATIGIATALFLLASLPGSREAEAQEAQLLKRLIQELSELCFRKGSATAAEQLAKIGGKAAVEDVLQAAGREGGESLVRRTAQYGLEEGPVALRLIGRSPAKMVEALDHLPPAFRAGALRAAERETEALSGLVLKHGSGALEVAARHPGVGVRIAEGLGEEGIQLGRSLSTDQAIVLSRHLREIGALPAAERSTLLSKIAQAPEHVLDVLEKHPNVLLAGAGIGVALAVKNQVLGDPGGTEILPDGTAVQKSPAPGLAERLFAQTTQVLAQPLNAAGLVLAAGLAGWLGVWVFGAWRIQRLRYRIEEGKLGKA